jgi:O-methyltransferase involved in polyketide biosynthesis
MSETKPLALSGVAESLLVTLYIRAIESQRPDALLKDEKAVELVEQMSFDFTRVRQIPLSDANKLVIILRNRQFDRYTQDFLARCPDAVVVHIGCGLDTRFERVDNGRVEWYDLDFPEVIELRRKFIGGEKERYHLLGCSVLDDAWLQAVSILKKRPFLCLAEGVSMYLQGAQVRWLVLALRDRFPGAELVFDAFSPYLVWANNLRMAITKFGARYSWALRRAQDVESWGAGIRLLDQWSFFDRPEPRLAHVRWMRHVPLLGRVMCIYHYQLGREEE